MTTFVNLRAQCATRFRDAANAVVTDLVWKDYVNQAYQEVNADTPLWPWLETSEQTVTVAANTRGIALPTDIVQVNWAYDSTDDYRLRPQEGRGDPWHVALRSTTGLPLAYRLRAGNIELFPTPTASTTVILEGVLMPAKLVNDGDTPVWPSNFHELLIPGALALAFLDDGNAEFHDKQDARFRRQIAAMKAAILAFRTETNVPIRDTLWD